MGITSAPFAAFVLATLALFYVLPRRGQLVLLLLASYGFYATFAWPFPLLLLALAAANHLVGRRLWEGGGRPWLWAGIVLNVASLALLKYSGVGVDDVARVLGIGAGPAGGLASGPAGDAAGAPAASAAILLLLPIGLSYRVLENISFLVDASRRQLDGYPRFHEFALYAGYFPKLLSGPIDRARGFFTQLARPRIVDNDAVARGLTLVAIGLLRKLVLADTLRGMIPAGAFEAPFALAGVQLAFWLLVDVFVVYNDFAGYTDIVRGVSTFFGIELPRNFAAPFFARNFSEFWLRWHMSLSFWLRDYVFMPASRALLRRSASPNTLVNLTVPPLAAMLVSAIWHQAAWNILAWGLLWGAFLFLGRLPTLWRAVVPPDRQPLWRQALGTAGVIAMLTTSNVLFKLPLAEIGAFLARLVAPGGLSGPVGATLGLLGVSLAVDAVQHRSKDEAVFARWPLWARSVALAVVLLAAFVLTRAKVPAPFIYQGF